MPRGLQGTVADILHLQTSDSAWQQKKQNGHKAQLHSTGHIVH